MVDAVERAEKGLVDADLGGGVIKQRLARPGQGKSGSYRSVVFFRLGERAVFAYGFSKSRRANISDEELDNLRKAAGHLLGLTKGRLEELAEAGDLVEVQR